MGYKYLELTVEEPGIAVLKVSRPDALNALNSEVIEELTTFFQSLQDDNAIRGVIFTGSGTKAFIAGADIKEMSTLTVVEAREFARNGQRLTVLIQESRKPVIAAVNGYALGGGCELALACHLRFASDNAVLGQPEVGLGIIPGWGGTQRLPKLVGPAKATELIISGKKINAEDARTIGLVNEIYSPEELIPETIAYLEQVLQQGPVAVALSLEAIQYSMNNSLSDGLAHESALFGLAFDTEDMDEGIRAFLKKRKPEFRGK